MLLKQLVASLPDASIDGSLDKEITGLTYDSRRVSPGMIFVAIPGQNSDGHNFIPSAVERGAVLAGGIFSVYSATADVRPVNDNIPRSAAPQIDVAPAGEARPKIDAAE